jgi:hypothetical protein
MNKFIYSVLLIAALALNAVGADITGVNNAISSAGSSGNASACSNLVSTPIELYSLTISGGTSTGTNILVTLRDSANTSLTTTATYTTTGSYVTNVVRTYVNYYGVSTSVTNYNVLFSYTNAATSYTITKPTVAALNYTPGTPVTYTFSPPLVFAQGLTLTNSQVGGANNSGITVTYGYSPAL